MRKTTKQIAVTGRASEAPGESSEAKRNEERCWTLPAVRGVQAGRIYYAVMIHLRSLGAFFSPVDTTLAPELRSQRALNKARVPKIAEYILGNRNDYTFSALTGAIDGDPVFRHAWDKSPMGILRIPLSATIAILDGQHRKAAIESAVKEEAARKRGGGLGDESIAVILFVDRGLARAQQCFADLNRFAVRPNGSLGLLYDHRDETAALAKAVVAEVPVFQKLTESEKTSVGGGGAKLFALSALHAATRALLASTSLQPADARATAVSFWTEVASVMPAWQEAVKGAVRARDLRDTYVHAHAVALEALGRVGSALLRDRPDRWRAEVQRLAEIDWSRAAPLWVNRAIVNGKVMKTSASVVLTANVVKTYLGLELGIEDRRLESRLRPDA